MADLRIVDAPVLLQESITDDVKMPTGGLGNYAIRLGDLVWYVITKENLASKSYVNASSTKSVRLVDKARSNVVITLDNCSVKNVTFTDPVINYARQAKVVYDPPSLATATQQSTTVMLTGAKLGDNINVSFDKVLQGTRMWGEVTAVDTVTVYHRNDTGATVDLPSGTLTVKIV